MITGRSITDALKASLPQESKSKEFYQKQVEIWTNAIEQGLDKKYGMDLSHLINHYKAKAQ
jgi:hypothetical protein